MSDSPSQVADTLVESYTNADSVIDYPSTNIPLSEYMRQIDAVQESSDLHGAYLQSLLDSHPGGSDHSRSDSATSSDTDQSDWLLPDLMCDTDSDQGSDYNSLPGLVSVEQSDDDDSSIKETQL